MLDHWEYKGHVCEIDEDREEDNIKLSATVRTPDGKVMFPDISPYQVDRVLVNAWIDAGYPKRNGIGPLREEDLLQ